MKSSNDLAHEFAAVADRDITLLRELVRARHIDDALWGFHAQQATEKLLKAILAVRGGKPPFTHHLFDLANLLDSRGIDLPEGMEPLLELTPYAGELRYSPSMPDCFDPLDREATMVLITTLREFTRKQTGF